ncbi:hypothetical protein [Azohydromonas aeria]|uniref:hypothetical protein n=1 Tax=Azohydromonas aeria TaxID=2590212 RepID=UPI0012F72DE9|nr:hypothetical protein [Azohydromonas aeria]
MLATVKHECAATRQFRKGAGRAYGPAETVSDEAGNSVRNTYYGHGLGQLTWRENYLAMGMRLGISRVLEIYPERALDFGIAYRVMSEGMQNGVFTGRSLARYIDDEGYRQPERAPHHQRTGPGGVDRGLREPV